MKTEVTVPIVVEQDETGTWVAHALLDYNVGANGDGDTREAAIADLREALTALIQSVGVPETVTVSVETPS